MMGALGLLMNMTGYERITFVCVTGAALLNVLLTLALVPIFGIEGAAVASSFTLIVYNIVLWKQVRKYLGVNTLPFKFGRH
jgi:O-antigen/teichoic acid export membrane protein